VRDKEEMHRRLLERGKVGDYVVRESGRGGLTLVCKIADAKLSFPHINTQKHGWQVHMEGSKHLLKSIYHMLEHIAALAKTPARELILDSREEDSYVMNQEEGPVYDFGCRTPSLDAGGFFKAADKTRVQAEYAMADSGAGAEPVYAMANGAGRVGTAPAATAAPEYAVATESADVEALYDMATAVARPPQAAAQPDYSLGSAGGEGGDIYDLATVPEQHASRKPAAAKGQPVYAVADDSAAPEYALGSGDAGDAAAVYDVADAVRRPPPTTTAGAPDGDMAQPIVYDVADAVRRPPPKKSAGAARPSPSVEYDVAANNGGVEYDLARS